MRHPFDGIVTPATPSRRSWLGGTLAAVASLVFGSRVFEAAPPARSIPMDDTNPEPKPKAGKVTQAFREAAASTKALREEAMTRALNENGIKPLPRVTTLALNEEGN